MRIGNHWIDPMKVLLSVLITVVIFVGWNIASSPVEHLGTDQGYIKRMYIDMYWIPPTFDKDGKQTSGGYWDEDFYIIIEFDSGKRNSFIISEHRWRRDFVEGDRVTVEYYKRGILPYHEIDRQ